MPDADDPAWWREVKSPLEFCEKAGLSERGKAQFLDAVKAPDNMTIIRFAWSVLLKLGFAMVRVGPLLKSDDIVIKTFIFLDKNYGDKLSDEQRATAASEIEELLRFSRSSLPAFSRSSLPAVSRFNKAAEAFSSSEKPASHGHFPSKSVFVELMNQHAQYGSHYVSPYTTIVGPSGIGKSFVVQQLAIRYGVYVVYNNLAPATSRGFPRPVAMGATPIVGELDAMVKKWMEYLENQLLIADCCKQSGITAPGLFHFLTSNSDQILAARATFETLITSLLETEDKMARVCQGLAAVKEVLQELGLNNTPTTPTNDSTLPVIICFDEARALLDGAENRAFRSLRQAAKRLADKKEVGVDGKKETVSFFMLLLDTTSKISNFTPPVHHDPSAKVANRRLFHPIHQIDSLNVFAPESLPDPSGQDLDVELMFSYGRPLWGALLQAHHSWKSLLSLAIDKMSKCKDRALSDIAVLSYRMSFYISSATMAKDLVASMMRCLIAISPDRNDLITAQPSEPVLAFAASKLLQDPTTRLSCVQSWVGGLHSGALNPGDIGEQVASLILLFAFDSVAFSMPAGLDSPPRAVPLGDFIAALFGQHVQNDLCRRHAGTATGQLLHKGTVFFNHFVRTSAAPTLEVLENAYRRGAALFLPALFPGMDVALPIRATPEGPLALLMLQVKNRKGDGNTPGLRLSMEEDLRTAVKHLGLSTGLHSVVGLAMCLRTQGDSQFVAMEPSGTVVMTAAAEAAPSTPSTRSTATRKKKAAMSSKKKASVTSKISSEFLGIAFGLDPTVYHCLQAPSSKRKRKRLQADLFQSKRGQEEMEAISRLLGRLVNTWPNAYAKADTESTYAQRLLDPFYDVAEAADAMNEEEDNN